MLARVRQRTVAKAHNSVIESSVDVQRDIDAINSGRVQGRGGRYTVNGRTYGVEANGTAYPIAGPGIHVLDRGAFKALGVYNTVGPSERAEVILDAMGIGPPECARALAAWQAERGA
jgi:hypothetical protein